MQRSKTLTLLTLLLALITAAGAAQPIPPGELLRRNPVSANNQGQRGVQPATGVGSNPFLLIDYPGAIANQYPAGINDRGRIVGIAGFPDGSFRGYLLQGTTFKDIVYPGGMVTGAYSINQSGVIVGVYCSDPTCYTVHGFELKGKTYTSIDYPGGTNTQPYGVNAAGDIVGFYVGPDIVVHGFLLHKGVYSTIDVPGSTSTLPLSINKQGTMVGIVWFADGHGGHGFILQNGVFSQFDYPGAYGTGLYGINDGGDIVGSYDDVQGGGPTHGFLVSGGVTTVVDVPFPGSTETYLSGLNNKHQIVGSYASFQPDYLFGFLTTY